MKGDYAKTRKQQVGAPTGRTATETVMDIRCQLRMLGVPLDGPAMMLETTCQ